MQQGVTNECRCRCRWNGHLTFSFCSSFFMRQLETPENIEATQKKANRINNRKRREDRSEKESVERQMLWRISFFSQCTYVITNKDVPLSDISERKTSFASVRQKNVRACSHSHTRTQPTIITVKRHRYSCLHSAFLGTRAFFTIGRLFGRFFLISPKRI